MQYAKQLRLLSTFTHSHSPTHPKGPMRTNLATKPLLTNKQRQPGQTGKQTHHMQKRPHPRPVLRIAHTFHSTRKNPRLFSQFERSHRCAVPTRFAVHQCSKQTIALPLTAFACVRLTLGQHPRLKSLYAMTGSEARRCLRADL